MTTSRTAGLALVAALALLPACTSTTWRGRFTPTPAETVVRTAEGAEPLARILMSVRGAERPGGDPEADFEMIVRLRVENESDQPLTLVLDRFLLLDAELEAFGRPHVLATEDGASDARAVEDGVAPGAFALVELAFPFPPGRSPADLHLSGLNLRGAVMLGDSELPVGASFSRTPRVLYRDPWPYPYGPYPYWYGPWYGPYGRGGVHVSYGYGW